MFTLQETLAIIETYIYRLKIGQSIQLNMQLTEITLINYTQFGLT